MLRRYPRWGVFLALVAFAGSPLARAAEPERSVAKPALEKPAEYVIQPEDVLAIKVSGEPTLTRDYPVSDRGEITVEMIGKVKAAGLTPKQLRDALTTELMKYLKIFEVSVNVAEVGARVLVFGEVAKPGSVKLKPGAKLLDVLAEAGQPTQNADLRRVAISRKKGGDPDLVDLEAVARDAKLNLALEPGDIVQVPSKAANTVRVDGEVTNTGPRPLDEARSAYAAITAAGPTAKADFARVILRRKGSDLPVTLDLSRVRTGQIKDDYKLEPGDQLTVMSRLSGFATLRGAVTSQGEKELNGTTQLWDLITGPGGGFAPGADQRRVQIVRGGQTAKVVNLLDISQGIKRSDDPDLEVRAGDLVFVPTALATLRGEVQKQGPQPISTAGNILDFVINAGGGFTDKADRTAVQVIRDGKVVATVDLTEIESGRKAYDDPAFAVLPGDTIHIPNDEKKRFVIVGGVKKPGAHRVKPGMTILDALEAGEGFSERANRQALVIAPASRFDGEGNLRIPEDAKRKATRADGRKPQPGLAGDLDPKDARKYAEYGLIIVDLKKLQKGDAKQIVPVNPGDRIFVPEEPPADTKLKKPSFWDRFLNLLPAATFFL